LGTTKPWPAGENTAEDGLQRAKKRRRAGTANGHAQVQGDTEGAEAIPKKEQSRPPTSDVLAPLYKPWELLPTLQQAHLLARVGGESSLESSVLPIVFTRNQNIRSGVNKINKYLTDREGKIVAISAQGEGTAKMVSILEMVKKIGKADSDGGEKSREWYMYTVLSSRSLAENSGISPEERGDRPEDEEAVISDEDEDAFEPISVRDRRGQEKNLKKTIPVLTVWLSLTPIPQFRAAFGEEKLVVAGARVQEEG
jgi:hypothetical protein